MTDTDTNVVPFAPPPLHDVMGFRGVHVLGDLRITEEGRAQLIARYYCSCLVQGRSPVWALYRASNGNFVRFYGYRTEIERAYPKLVWRRKMASWSLLAVDDLKPEARRRFLADKYQSEVPQPKESAA